MAQVLQQNPEINYAVAPYFYYHYTLRFLNYSRMDRVREWIPSSCELPEEADSSRPLAFVLDRGKWPTLQFLESLYPGGEKKILRDPFQAPLAYFYILPPRLVKPAVQMGRGLRGEYFRSPPGHFAPDFVRRDPLLNFTNIVDFPIHRPPLWARWKAQLEITQPGPYEFLVITSQKGSLFLDEKPVPAAAVMLGKGAHGIRLEMEPAPPSQESSAVDCHLLWKKPGQADFEVIPNSAWGKLKCGL